MGQVVPDCDVVEDGLVEVLDELERQVGDDLFHERRRVHHVGVAVDASEPPLSHDTDRPAHARFNLRRGPPFSRRHGRVPLATLTTPGRNSLG